MNFNKLYNAVPVFISMEIFSNILSIAVNNIKSKHIVWDIQTKDVLEKWGVSSKDHEYCYGRHLYYNSPNTGQIPFWIGLDISKNGIFVTVTFSRKTLDDLSLTNKVTSIAGSHSILPSHCSNTQQDYFIEIQLVPADYKQLCSTELPKILEDFLDEVLSAL